MAKLSAGAKNSKELTEGNRETRDWKRSSNLNWEQQRSELRFVCLSLDLGFFFFFLSAVDWWWWWWWRRRKICAVWWW